MCFRLPRLGALGQGISEIGRIRARAQAVMLEDLLFLDRWKPPAFLTSSSAQDILGCCGDLLSGPLIAGLCGFYIGATYGDSRWTYLLN